MTKQEALKRRIRERMTKTGERYGAARRVVLAAGESAPPPTIRVWAAEPEFTDEVIRTNTGQSWDEWCGLIEAFPGHVEGHAPIAAHLIAEHGLNGWWAHGVTVGFERITGRRLKNQMADGTFTAAKTKTVTVDVEALRALLVDDAGRADLFPGFGSVLRSKPTSKALKVGFETGAALFSIEALADGRTRINVAHEGLASAVDVELWKAYWADWLAAIDEG